MRITTGGTQERMGDRLIAREAQNEASSAHHRLPIPSRIARRDIAFPCRIAPPPDELAIRRNLVQRGAAGEVRMLPKDRGGCEAAVRRDVPTRQSRLEEHRHDRIRAIRSSAQRAAQM